MFGCVLENTIFYLLFTLSHIFSAVKQIYNIIHSSIQKHKQNPEKNIIKSSQIKRRRKRERRLGSTKGEITRRNAAIAIGAMLQSQSARCYNHDRRDAATIRLSSKGKGRSRKREIDGTNWELNGAISPLRLGLGRCICESFFLSLFLPLHVCELLSLHVSVPKVIWR